MKRRTLALVCVWTLPSLVLVTVTAIVFAAFRIAPPDRLDAAERRAVMATLRAALAAPAAPAGPPAPPPGVHRPLTGPLVVTVWSNGRSVARVQATGEDVAAATVTAARGLRDDPAVRALSPRDRATARLQVDLVTGRGGLGEGSWLVEQVALPGIDDLLGVNPGVEGVGAEIGGKPVVLLPHELVAARILTAKHPLPGVPDFELGVDVARIRLQLATRAGASSVPAPSALYRFRTDTFVEALDPTAAPLPLYRGLPAAPKLSAQALRDAALQGGRYLVAHLAPSGRFIYEHELWSGAVTDDARIDSGYSMPRHSGVTYFLAELYRITQEPWLREPIERALGHLTDLLAQGHCDRTLPDGTAIDCVLDRGEIIADVGSTALAVVALVEYQRATGDPRYLALATRLAAWLLYMQRPDGSFRHLYDVTTGTPDDETQLLYCSGEATLALARMHVITGDARYAAAAERGLDWQVDWYDFFIGGFFYGEEHWACITAEALWPAVKRERYVEFCHGYAAFLRAQQAEAGEHPDEDDYTGSYTLTPFVVPYNTPAGSRTEAMLSTYLLGERHGSPDPRVAGQIRSALQYVLGQQIRPDSDYNVLATALGQGDGAMPGTPVDRNIRIDYLQHVGSAMIRASEWIDRAP
jgi:hypothetical protein